MRRRSLLATLVARVLFSRSILVLVHLVVTGLFAGTLRLNDNYTFAGTASIPMPSRSHPSRRTSQEYFHER